ncbi:MAG: metallophosphoesterase family protein [Desulfobacteraceae bacterium]|nr:metallophosphoesterase family protein [Desulfobacteraceae bacterium]
MKVAVFSDVHSCYSKMKATFVDMKKHKIDQFICLGDIIGYGDKPEETIKLLIEKKVTSIRGNHELAMFDMKYRKTFPKIKKQPLLDNIAVLSNDSIRYLENTKPYLKLKNCHFVHGTPPDRTDTYIYDVNDYYLKSLFNNSEEQVFFTGHTHKLQLITYKDKIVMRQRITQNCTIYLEEGQKYLLTVGSIGFPRDNYKTSKYVIYDSLNKFIIIRMVRN